MYKKSFTNCFIYSAYLFIFLLFVNEPFAYAQDIQKDYLYGTWISVGLVKNPSKDRQEQSEDIEKHLIYFNHNGEVMRFSPQKGWVTLLIEYKIENYVIFSRAYNAKEYLPLFFMRKDKMLQAYHPRRDVLLYKKNFKKITEIDFNTKLTIIEEPTKVKVYTK